MVLWVSGELLRASQSAVGWIKGSVSESAASHPPAGSNGTGNLAREQREDTRTLET